MTDPDRLVLIDPDRSAHLCDAGSPGFTAAVCVRPDGRDALWLVDRAELSAEHPRHGNGDQPHEQLGPLPDRYRLGVRCTPIRCGRPTATGRPCRTPVHRPGDGCHWHRRVSA